METVERWSVAPANDEQVVEHGEQANDELARETPLAPPIKSRFLFVNVAGKRAMQLRRGAKPRVEVRDGRRYAERLAMEEVRRVLIPYTVAE
jgi:DNA-directed RNA polymerase subunit K/omega